MSNFCKRMRFFSLIGFTGRFFQILYSLFRHRLKTEISKFSNKILKCSMRNIFRFFIAWGKVSLNSYSRLNGNPFVLTFSLVYFSVYSFVYLPYRLTQWFKTSSFKSEEYLTLTRYWLIVYKSDNDLFVAIIIKLFKFGGSNYLLYCVVKVSIQKLQQWPINWW